jgi:hypothetical protein
MAQYRKKPVVIEAWQFTKRNFKEGTPKEFKHKDVLLWSQYGGKIIEGEINTLEGVMNVSENDYIIKGVKGEYYPCKPDIFEMTYEKVDENPSPCIKCGQDSSSCCGCGKYNIWKKGKENG